MTKGISCLNIMLNLFFGPSAHLEYAQTMFNFPSLFKVDTLIQKYLPKEKNSD